MGEEGGSLRGKAARHAGVRATGHAPLFRQVVLPGPSDRRDSGSRALPRIVDKPTTRRFPEEDFRTEWALMFGRLKLTACRGISDNVEMADGIIRDPEIMHGIPFFRGTRVPVQTLFDYLEGGDTLHEFLEGFPTVSCAMALNALEEARTLLLTHR